MTAGPLDDYRPSYLRKSYARESFPIDGPQGALALLRKFGLPHTYGPPSQAVVFRDETGWARCISAYFPSVRYCINLHINRHISHVGFSPMGRTFANLAESSRHRDVIYRMRCRAERFRGEGL